MGAASAADACVVCVPAAEYWELDGMLPTGRRLPVDAARDLRAGRRFGEVRLDDVLTGLPATSAGTTASIFDPAAGRRLELQFDPAFRHCVVYNPPHREAICLEPYTTGADPFRLAAKGIHADQQVLEPGQSWSASMRLTMVAAH
jgi:aldose 1-epimerase